MRGTRRKAIIPCRDLLQTTRCYPAPIEEPPVGRKGQGSGHLVPQPPVLEESPEVQDGS